jgi:hypothetical protein
LEFLYYGCSLLFPATLEHHLHSLEQRERERGRERERERKREREVYERRWSMTCTLSRTISQPRASPALLLLSTLDSSLSTLDASSIPLQKEREIEETRGGREEKREAARR